MAIILIILLGLFLRVISLNQSLWLDEAISALASRDFSYQGIIFDFLKIDNHPPFFYLMLKFWGGIFGFSDLALRFLPVIIGALVIYPVYKITQNLTGDKNTSLTAALLTATSPILIYYSQEIRMYILITLLCVLQIFLFTLKKENLTKWILISLLNCLLFFSDYITVFFFSVLFAFPLFSKNFKLLKNVLLSFIPLAILFIFWYPQFTGQIAKNSELVSLFPKWEMVIGGATLKNLAVAWAKFVLGRISFNPNIFYYGLVGIFSLPVFTPLYFACKNYQKYLLIWIWFFVPIITGFLFSFYIPVFNYFRFIFVVPALLILIAVGVKNLKPHLKYLILGSIIFGNIISLSVYYFDPSQQRENWRQAVSFIEENAKSDDLVVFEFREEVAPYRFYANGIVDSLGALDSYTADKKKTNMKLMQGLQNKNGVYYFEYLRDLSDPNRIVEQKLESEGFKKGEVYNDFKNIGQITRWTR